MMKPMTTKEHYKMYKKDKLWVFAGIFTVTLGLNVGESQTAHAATTDATTTGEEKTTTKAVTASKTVTLKSAQDKVTTATTADDQTTEEDKTGEATPDQPATDQDTTNQQNSDQTTPKTDQQNADQADTGQANNQSTTTSQESSGQTETTLQDNDQATTDQQTAGQAATDQPATTQTTPDQVATDSTESNQQNNQTTTTDQPATDQTTASQQGTDQPTPPQSTTSQPENESANQAVIDKTDEDSMATTQESTLRQPVAEVMSLGDEPATPTVASIKAAAATVNAPVAVPTADESIDEWMPNKTLQQWVLYALNNAGVGKTWTSVDQITKEDMLYLTGKLSSQSMHGTTYIDGKSSFSLEGLQYATNLTELDLLNNVNSNPYMMRGDITDISPLSALTNLTWLQLGGNRISDITPIAGLKKVTYLVLGMNSIADFSSLNPAQYTDGLSIGQQFVELETVYVPKVDASQGYYPEYTTVNPVKAPQGMTMSAKYPMAVALPVVSLTQSEVASTVKIFWTGGAMALSPDGTEITYKVAYNQEPWYAKDTAEYGVPTNFGYDQQVPGDYLYSMVANFTMSGYGDSLVVSLVTPYVTADAAQSITVNYVDEAGKALRDPDVLSDGLIGEPYTLTAPDIDGYTLTEMPANATGTYSDQPQTVTFVYKEAVGTITVTYQDDQGNQLLEPETLTGKVGEAYTVPAKTIDGYTLTETPANATGTYTQDAQTVAFVYTKDTTPVTPPTPPTQTVTVTVHHQTADGTTVAPDVTLTGEQGDAYTTEPVEIPGYTLVTTPDNDSGTFGASDSTVTYIYAKDVEEGEGGDQVTPETPTPDTKPDKTKPGPNQTKPTGKPGIEADQAVRGGSANQITGTTRRGTTTPTQLGTTTNSAADKVNLKSMPTQQPATQTPQDQAKAAKAATTLPQTNDQTISGWWGAALLALLGSVVGFKRKFKE